MARCDTTISYLRNARAPYTALLRKLSSEFNYNRTGVVAAGNQKTPVAGTVHYVDLLPPFCDDEGICTETLPNQSTLGFKDSNHLNSAGTYYLSAFLCQALEHVL